MSSSSKSYTLNDSGKKYLIEQCQRIQIKDYTKKAKEELKHLLINSQLEFDGFSISLSTSKTYYSGLRYWFKCPLCGSRAGVLYKHPISNILGCRKCLGLEYRCKRFKGMIEGLDK
jgi:hypothetical protein